MKRFIKITIIALSLGFSTLHAENAHHEDSHHKTLTKEMSNEAVQQAAKDEVQRLASEKKIAKSWKSVPILKIGRTHYGDNDDWIVVFNNPKIKKTSRKNLYIFVSKQGQIRGANYTGM